MRRPRLQEPAPESLIYSRVPPASSVSWHLHDESTWFLILMGDPASLRSMLPSMCYKGRSGLAGKHGITVLLRGQCDVKCNSQTPITPILLQLPVKDQKTLMKKCMPTEIVSVSYESKNYVTRTD